MADQVLDRFTGTDLPLVFAPLDNLCALWIDQAPRFGAVAAHFPESLRKRRFVASFWALEVLLFGDLYLSSGRCWTRDLIDKWAALLVERAGPAGEMIAMVWLPAAGLGQLVDTGKPRFWSPNLPRVTEWGCWSAAGWRGTVVWFGAYGEPKLRVTLVTELALTSFGAAQ